MSSLAQKNGNDCVFTPQPLARAIVHHFKPNGVLLDPCSGEGVFRDEMYWFSENDPNQLVDEFEISRGTDFLAGDCLGRKYDWVVTNPPWSQLRAFLKRSMEVSDNVVFLCLTNALFYNGRQDDIAAAGFGIREIARVKQPRKPWPQTGFMLSANWLQRDWDGPASMTRLDWKEEPEINEEDFWG
jgi:hypothetical protein